MKFQAVSQVRQIPWSKDNCCHKGKNQTLWCSPVSRNHRNINQEYLYSLGTFLTWKTLQSQFRGSQTQPFTGKPAVSSH